MVTHAGVENIYLDPLFVLLLFYEKESPVVSSKEIWMGLVP